MQVAIPHQLGKEEVRRRLSANSHRLADGMPGMAEVTTDWPSEDRMRLSVRAMGQVVDGHVDVEEAQVIFHVTLPPALGFFQPIVEGAIRQQGPRLLGPPSGDPTG
jgi:uncharacterized protein involved in copper resistance